MEQIVLITPNGQEVLLNTFEPARAVTKAEQTKQLLGRDDIIMSVETSEKLELPIGTKFYFSGDEYTLNVISKNEKTGNRRFLYDLNFEAPAYDLIRAVFLNIDATGFYTGFNFDFIGTLANYGELIINSANNQFGAGRWILGDTADSETKTLSFTNLTALGALNQICDEFKVEYSVELLSNNRRRLNLKKVGSFVNIPFAYGYNLGATAIRRIAVSDSKIINKVYPLGSTENLPYGYRNHSTNLKIGDAGQDFLEDQTSIEAIGVHAGGVVFDDIKPERIGTVTAIDTDLMTFFDTGMDFDLSEKIGQNTTYLIPNVSAKITFQTGGLAGKQYDLNSYDHATKKFKLNPVTDENQLTTPSVEPFIIHVGDRYVLSDINMPQSYVDAAEGKLRTEAQIYLDANKVPLVSYAIEADPVYIRSFMGENTSAILQAGDTIPIYDEDLGIDKAIRITGYTRNVLSPEEYSFVVADSYDVNYINKEVIADREIQTVIRINDLRDPIKAKQNWRNTEELKNLIFDPEGNYYTDKIKPLSIETTMLSVGAKSQQFILNLVIEPNYNGQPNNILVNAGTLVHYTIEAAIRTWYIPQATVAVNTDDAYYIYAKCNRTTQNATILFSRGQIKVDEDGSFYHFLIGVLHTKDPEDMVRFISLTYGASTINGRFITTGTIKSADGATGFNLDTGTIFGKITFRQADGTSKNLADAYQEQKTFAQQVTQQLGEMDGLIETWYYAGVPTLQNQPAVNWTSLTLKDDHLNDLYYDTNTGKAYRFIKTGSGSYEWRIIEDQDITNALAIAQQALDTADGKRRVFVVQPFPPYDVGDLWTNGADLFVCIQSRASGSFVQTDWDTATTYDSTATVINGGLVTTGGLRLVGDDGLINAGITGGGTGNTAIRFWAGASFANKDVAPFRVNQGGEVFARKRIEVMNSSNVGQAGICGANSVLDGLERIWAGTPYDNRANAPFRVLADGKMFATAGAIGNWNISSGGIVNESGTAYIIGRSTNAVKRTEFILGSNVFPATFGGKGAAVFRATEDNTTGDNFAMVTYAQNATNGFINWNLYAYDGVSYMGQTLINGRRPLRFNIAGGQNLSFDPTLYDIVYVNPTGGGNAFITIPTTGNRFLIGDGKRLTVINVNDNNSNLYFAPGVLVNGLSTPLAGGVVMILNFDIVMQKWWIESLFNNDF